MGDVARTHPAERIPIHPNLEVLVSCPLYAGGSCGPTVTTVAHHVVSHVVPAAGGSLAFTGGDAIAALIVGGSLLIGGLALAWKGRRVNV